MWSSGAIGRALGAASVGRARVTPAAAASANVARPDAWCRSAAASTSSRARPPPEPPRPPLWRHFSRSAFAAGFATGVLLEAAYQWATRDDADEDGRGDSGGGSVFSRIRPLASPPVLRAAEVIDKKDASNTLGGFSVPKTRRSSYNFMADVVEEVAASLVYIEIKDTGVRDFFTGTPVTSSNGSGFIVKEDGLILTNAHVVINKPRASVQVRLQDGRIYTGKVEDVDIKSDLATVRIPCKGLPVMPLGESRTLRPGEFVIAMGSPLSLSNTITTGVISTVSRPKQELGLKDRIVPEYIQTDAAITFGNSGGPLVNLDGQAIGINSMKVTPGISFAIPIDYAKEFLVKSEEARKKRAQLKPGQVSGTGDRRYVGITMLTINPQVVEELRARLEMPEEVKSGIVLFRIIRGSPADRAGLMPGDVITHVNGSVVHGSKDFYHHLEGENDLKMRVIRRHRVFEVLVKPENTR